MAAAERAPRKPWRDNIEAVTMAVIMALLLKCFLLEAYKIPTGSMQPTLIGDEDLGIFDRILVDKLSFSFRDPKRWEVVVFRFPLDHAKNFVKRVAGVGPEDFRIMRGDLWHRRDVNDDWSILRRPRIVQRSVWKRLDAFEPEATSWTVTDGGHDWEIEARSIQARGDGHAAFQARRGAVLDRYADGYPDAIAEEMDSVRRGAVNRVADLRVDGTVRALPGTQAVVIDLDEGPRRYRFTLPGPAAEEDARPRILEHWRGRGRGDDPRHDMAEAPYRLPAGRTVSFGVQNMDDLLELEIDGEFVCALEIESVADQSAGASLGVVGEGADFADLMVYRDIYYTATTTRESVVSIPAGHYYMLGDNTQDSSDSREWAYARFGIPGSVEGEQDVVRGNFRPGENPLTVGFGEEGGPLTHFIDEWGEGHWFGSGSAVRMTPVNAPFVPRRLILGRALAVFWPLDPRLDLYRLKWVN